MPDYFGILSKLALENQRSPTSSEETFFRSSPHVGGYAAPDNKIVLNPFSPLTPEQQRAILVNEYARIKFRQNPEYAPYFDITKQQNSFLDSMPEYANADPKDRRGTIAARLLSGDQSAGQPTSEQQDYVGALIRLLTGLGVSGK